MQQISFTGLPSSLHQRKLNGLKPRELAAIIKDAGEMAGIEINTTGSKVKQKNPLIFNTKGIIDAIGARMLKQEYGATNARELRDALIPGYRKYTGDGILDMII